VSEIVKCEYLVDEKIERSATSLKP